MYSPVFQKCFFFFSQISLNVIVIVILYKQLFPDVTGF